MATYQPPYTITSKILKLTSEISELISDIKYIDKKYSTLNFVKKIELGRLLAHFK